MPLPMVHLGVARKFAVDTFLIDCPKFYLGSISPDAVHMRDNLSKDDKTLSHLRVADDRWLENVLDFLKLNKDSADFNFFIGYGIHILTDIIWHDTLYAQFKSLYHEDPAPVEDIRAAYYNDTDKLDFELFKICKWRENIWQLLSEAEGVDLQCVLNAAEINDWNRRTLHWYDRGESQHQNPVKYINLDDLFKFIKKTGTGIKSIMKSEGILNE